MEKGESREKIEATITNVDTKEQETVEATVSETPVDDEDSLVIKFKKPFTFEQKEYEEIDLTGLEDLTAQDMVSVDRILKRHNSGIDVMPEVSMEYALNLAAKAAKQPIEFFQALPPREAMKVKNRIMGFLFGSD